MNAHKSSFTRQMRVFWWTLSLATVTTLLLAACGGGGGTATTSTPTPAPTATTAPSTPSPTPTIAQVKIVEANEKYAFSPATLTIKVGTQIVWTNTSDAPHTVTSDMAGVFGTTGNITQNQTFMFTFTSAGTFAYHCNIHPYMKATITVTS
jgi:plastocyanin